MFQTPNIHQMQIVNALKHICQEWQDATPEESLLEVEGNMGLLLADLINKVA